MSTIESLEAEVAQLRAKLEQVAPTPRKPINESAERYLEMALSRMQGDVTAAANLFFVWTEQDSGVRESLRPIIQEAIEARLAKIPQAEPDLA